MRLLAAALAAATAVAASVDVLVYGGTPSGIMSAIAAVGEGMSVLLVHPTSHLGGMVTGGLGNTDKGNPAAIGGLARSFFQGICKAYGQTGECYTFEPHVASAVFAEMISAAGRNLTVLTGLTATSAIRGSGASISSLTFGDTSSLVQGLPPARVVTYNAAAFIDASYEGDILPLAGVPWTAGREGVDQYNESLAGRLFVPNKVGGHQFNVPLNYTYGNGTLLPLVYGGDPGVVGAADAKIQGYNFRMCLTLNASNSVPIAQASLPAPSRPDAERLPRATPDRLSHHACSRPDMIRLTGSSSDATSQRQTSRPLGR